MAESTDIQTVWHVFLCELPVACYHVALQAQRCSQPSFCVTRVYFALSRNS